jgi:prepilin-type N-terminal cleavage/methylation domain-containing protein
MSAPKKIRKSRQAGFSLLELMVATTLFVIITGVVFAVVIATQVRYKAEKEYMGTFQQANVAIDQIARDIHGAGFPAKIVYNTSVQTAANAAKYALPVAWAPNYPNTPCVIGTTCTSPGAYDLILEEDQGAGVVWIRYKLTTNILYRGVVAKTANTDPVNATNANGVLVPYLENVMNNASSAQIATITASYPGTFPGGTAVPVFSFPTYQGIAQAPPNIHNINIALIVQAPNKDLQTQGVRIATFTAQASTVNPYQ